MSVPDAALIEHDEQLRMLFSFRRSRFLPPQFAHPNQRGLQYRQVVGPQGGIQFMCDFVDHGRKIGNGIGRTRVLPNIPINDLGKPTNSLVHLSIPGFLRRRSRAAHLSSSWHERAKSALGLLLAAEARRPLEMGGAPLEVFGQPDFKSRDQVLVAPIPHAVPDPRGVQ